MAEACSMDALDAVSDVSGPEGSAHHSDRSETPGSNSIDSILGVMLADDPVDVDMLADDPVDADDMLGGDAVDADTLGLPGARQDAESNDEDHLGLLQDDGIRIAGLFAKSLHSEGCPPRILAAQTQRQCQNVGAVIAMGSAAEDVGTASQTRRECRGKVFGWNAKQS